MGKLGNIVSTVKMFLNLLGNIFASWEANFSSATMFSEVGKQGNINRKHNVSVTMFPSSPGLYSDSIFTEGKLNIRLATVGSEPTTFGILVLCSSNRATWLYVVCSCM